MENTPRANRIHIGIFGKCNSGKSSLVNALTGQSTAIVSDVAGTTTDVVSKSMELPGLGAVTFMDTAGLDDRSELGARRIESTRKAVERTDVAVMVFAGRPGREETEWSNMLRGRGIPVVAVLNKADAIDDSVAAVNAIADVTGLEPVVVSSVTGEGIEVLRDAVAAAGRSAADEVTITGDLVSEGDVVMLVMPQDSQAPRGRLILPQVQTIRELLDKRCTVISCVPENMSSSLAALAAPPKLIITDSQVFAVVNGMTPPESMLTSFSVLFANYKGDIREFVAGAAAIDRLNEASRVLIAEACTHAPAGEDIGRVKIPNLLRKRVGTGLKIDVVGGSDFPDDLSEYDLIIHCGACMFNRRHVLSRIAKAREYGVPITNYGVTIAYLTGILGKVVYPGAGR